MKKIAFDTDKYLEEQSKQINRRSSERNKLYIEFGGKLIGDKHAKRVFPGFDEDAKIKLLARMRDKAEIIICILAEDIENKKMRGDYGIPYSDEVFRLIDEYNSYQIAVNSVLVTGYNKQPNAKVFIKNLNNRGIKTYTHEFIDGYPTDMDKIFGPDGFNKNEYIPTTKPVVIVTSPGAGSGKLATCLNQLYHEQKLGHDAGYAKFETFPVWNLPLKHPVNLAYEAATVDLQDVNVIDNYHFEAYGEVAVNYNRDIKIFPIIKRILENIMGEDDVYQSPTDMGINCVKTGIIDDEAVQEAAKQEIIRRYFNLELDYVKGVASDQSRERMKIIMEDSGLEPTDRLVVEPARQYEESLKARYQSNEPQGCIALELSDGQIVTGRVSKRMDATASVILNSLKVLSGINDKIDLLAPTILETITDLKDGPLKSRDTVLSANDVLIALSISAVTNPTAKLAYEQLDKLAECEAHSTYILTHDNEQVLKRLDINITSDPIYLSHNLYYD